MRHLNFRNLSVASVMVALAYVAAVGQPISGGGGGVWGKITGLLPAQVDLNTQLNGKSGCGTVAALRDGGYALLPHSPAYSNGASGVGATLTATVAGALTVDDYTPVLGDRIMVIGGNGIRPLGNGIYSLTTLGTVSVPYVLTRGVDSDTPEKINACASTPVVNGTNFQGTSWYLNGTISAIGTDNIRYLQGTALCCPNIPTLSPPYVQVAGASYGPVFSVTPPTNTGFSWANQGSSTATLSASGSLLITYAALGGLNRARCYLNTLPSSNGYTAIVGQATSSPAIGIGISDGTKLILVWRLGGLLQSYQFSDTSTLAGQYFSDYTLNALPSNLWIRFRDDNTDRMVELSGDGLLWDAVNQKTKNSFLTETQFGPCYETNTAGSPTTQIFDFRMTTP